MDLFEVLVDDDIFAEFLEWKAKQPCIVAIATAKPIPIVHQTTPPLVVEEVVNDDLKDFLNKIKKSAESKFKLEQVNTSPAGKYPAVQFPMIIYTKYKRQICKAAAYWQDCIGEDGKTKRGKFILRIIEVPESRKYLLNTVYASPSRAALAIQYNTESGWDAWKDVIHHRKISVYRKCKQGSGFINPRGTTVEYRDYLIGLCDGESKTYLTSEASREAFKKKVTEDQVFAFLERDLPARITLSTVDENGKVNIVPSLECRTKVTFKKSKKDKRKNTDDKKITKKRKKEQ